MSAIIGKKEKQKRYITYLKEKYIRYLKRKEERCRPAMRLGLKECQRCGFCCLSLTCVPRPDEIETIAKFLGLTARHLVTKYMVIDKYTSTHFFLRWAKEGQQDITGAYLPMERLFDPGYCMFFDKQNRVCKIYSVRPQEARDVNCWEKRIDDCRSGASFWKRYDICEFVPEFKPQGNLRIIRVNSIASVK